MVSSVPFLLNSRAFEPRLFKQSLCIRETEFCAQGQRRRNALENPRDHGGDESRANKPLLSISGVGDTLAGVVLAELPGPDVLRSSGEVIAYAGLNPRQHQSGTSVDRATRISKIGNAVLRAALYMPALSAMRYNPAIVALVTRLKSRGRLKPKQIVVAAMRKLLVLCFGVLKTGKPFDPAITMGC